MTRKSETPAVAYYRMSSDKQEASIPAQRRSVEAFAREHGYVIVRDYVDEGISGDATERRVGFQQMIQNCSSGEFKAILCWDQDRFGRFDPIEGGYWIKPIRDAGVRLVTVAQGAIDWDDFAGRIVWTVHQEAKNSYLRDLSRNVLRGHVETARRGEFLGGFAPLGYRVEEKRLVRGDEREVRLVRRIFRDYLAGQSLRSIANALNGEGIPSPHANRRANCSGAWSANGIRAMLVNRLYTGDFCWNRMSVGKYTRLQDGRPEHVGRAEGRSVNDLDRWIIIPDNHAALISRKVFEATQRRLVKRRKQTTPCRDAGFLFTGLLVCSHCGRRMHGEHEAGQRKYVCSGNKSGGGNLCSRFSTTEAEMLYWVCRTVEERLAKPSTKTELQSRIRRQKRDLGGRSAVKDLEARIAEIEAKLEKAKARILEVDEDMVGIVQEQVRKLLNQREQLESKRALAATPESSLVASEQRRIERAIKYTSALRRAIQRADRSLAREFLSSTIARVELSFTSRRAGSRSFHRLVRGAIFLEPSGELLNTPKRTEQVLKLEFVVDRAA